MTTAHQSNQPHSEVPATTRCPSHAVVRPASLTDYQAIRDLLHDSDTYHAKHLPATACVPDRPRFSRGEMSELLSNDNCLLLVAEARGAIAGFLEASLRFPTAPDEAPSPWCGVNSLAVRDSSRRRGLGTALMRAAERWAESKGVTQLRLTVYEFNAGARLLYERLGYATHARQLIKVLPTGNMPLPTTDLRHERE